MIKINPKFKMCEDIDEVKQFKTDIIDLSSHEYGYSLKDEDIVFIYLDGEFFEPGYTVESIKEVIKETLALYNMDDVICITEVPTRIKNNHIAMTAFELCGFVPLDGIYKDGLKMIYANKEAYPMLDANAKMYLSEYEAGLGMHNRFYIPKYDGDAISNINKKKDTAENINDN